MSGCICVRELLFDDDGTWDDPLLVNKDCPVHGVDAQPLPVASDAPIAHRMVQADLDARLELGIRRYGQPLQPFNGRDSLRDAYEEALDLVVYLRTLLYEQETK
jgi:hypothetical protein